jgi:hypothetical protein
MKISLVFSLLLFGISGHGSVAMAQSAGTFTATGNMNTPRFGHTATLLLNGKVLITGGAILIGNSAISINSAELYDPSTGAFTVTGDMTSVPYGHVAAFFNDGRVLNVATLLPDGRVLIIGPLGAELYDPSIGTFTPTGSMAVSQGPATLLNNGQVLMTGRSNAQLYDPATGAFTSTGAYADAGPALQWSSVPTLLADGRVLITGCTDNHDYCEYVPADVAQLYDPATETFSLTGNYGFTEGTTTLLTNGKVLFAGGRTDWGPWPYSKLYEPSTGTFTPTGDMTNARVGHTATLLPDGRLLITGSLYSGLDGHSNQSAELYDSSTGTFRSIGNMTARRGEHAATLLKDGRVLITGGRTLGVEGGSPPGTNLSSAEVYWPPVLSPASRMFSLSGDGQGQGAIWHAQTGQIASADNPAVAGEALSMYTTGLADGGVIPPQVAIGGRLAEVLYFGAAPGYPGYDQVNFRVPSGVSPGAAISVRLSYLSRPSNAVSIGVQ